MIFILRGVTSVCVCVCSYSFSYFMAVLLFFASNRFVPLKFNLIEYLENFGLYKKLYTSHHLNINCKTKSKREREKIACQYLYYTHIDIGQERVFIPRLFILQLFVKKHKIMKKKLAHMNPCIHIYTFNFISISNLYIYLQFISSSSSSSLLYIDL